MLELRNINILYEKKECIKNGYFKALAGNITGIYGESGTGKSSLLYLLGMLDDQDCDYYLNGKLRKYNEVERRKFRNEHISFISQNIKLIETITVEKNVEFFLKMYCGNYSVDEVLRKVNLYSKKSAMPKSLSGGERQRIAIACALIKNTDIILGDELTSALDEENKKIIINLLRECADEGKIVIIVSHDKNILEQCDSLYKIEHLKLIQKKNNINTTLKQYNCERKFHVSLVKLYDILFLPNKKQTFIKIIFSAIISLFLFFSISILQMNMKTISSDSYNTDNISNNKLLVLSDVSGNYSKNAASQTFHVLYQYEPFQEDIDYLLNTQENVEKVYDYYILEYDSLNKMGYTDKMKIKATRNGEEVSRHKSDVLDMHVSSDGEYTFSVIPFYNEESLFKDKDGVYINSNMAYYYNLNIGDNLDIDLNIPFAMAKSIEKETTLIDNINDIESEPYHKYFYISDQIKYKTKVLGIIDSNTYENELYMNNQEMQELINKKIDEYKTGLIKINKNAYDGYSHIVPLESYAKVIFVNESDNVLSTQNTITNQSNNVYVYNEYQEVFDLKKETDSINHKLIMTTIFVLGCIVFGTFVLEYMYLKKNDDLYLMLRFLGVEKKEIYKYAFLHYIMQIMIVLSIAIVIYLSGSIPELLAYFRKENLISVYGSFPYSYRYYCYYTRFTFSHIRYFIPLSLSVLGLCHFISLLLNNKRNIIQWLRKKD